MGDARPDGRYGEIAGPDGILLGSSGGNVGAEGRGDAGGTDRGGLDARDAQVVHQKNGLRRQMRMRRVHIPLEEARTAGEAIALRVSGTPEWQAASRVLGYVATRGEVDCRPLLEAAFQEGKEVFLPKPDPKEHALRPCRWRLGEPLREGPYGIPVPAGPEGPEGELCDVLLVPGLAFDRRGLRLGAGGGYYDRYLSRRGGGWVLGMAYDWQLVSAVPATSEDRGVDAVATPSGLHRASVRA